MSKITIGLLLGYTREGRLCDRVAAFVKRVMKKDHNVDVFDPLEMDLPLTQRAINPEFNSPSPVSDGVRRQNEMVTNCDALIVVTPEYYWSVTPALANIVTSLEMAATMWKPCAIISYSVSTNGGWVGAIQVRQLMSAVGCILTQKQMGIPLIHDSLDPEGHPASHCREKLEQELHITLSQLNWMTRAINDHRKVETPPPFSL